MIELPSCALMVESFEKPWTGVDPAVEAPGEGTRHPCVSRWPIAACRALRRLVGVPAALAVAHAVDRGNAEDEGVLRLVGRQRQDADGDVQTVGEGGDLARPAVGAEVFEDLHAVARFLAGRAGKRIFDGIRDPEPAAIVEGEVERLVDVRLGGDELDLEAGRQVEQFAFLLRRAMRRGGDVGVGLGLRAGNRDEEKEGQHGDGKRNRAHHFLGERRERRYQSLFFTLK